MRLSLHTDKGTSMHWAMLFEKVEEMGVLRSKSRPSFSNVDPKSVSLLRTVKFLSDYLTRPFATSVMVCEWVAAFVDCSKSLHLHGWIEPFTLYQRHSGAFTTV